MRVQGDGRMPAAGLVRCSNEKGGPKAALIGRNERRTEFQFAALLAALSVGAGADVVCRPVGLNGRRDRPHPLVSELMGKAGGPVDVLVQTTSVLNASKALSNPYDPISLPGLAR